MVGKLSSNGPYLKPPDPARRSTPRLAPWQHRVAMSLLCQRLESPIDMGAIARRCRMTHGHFISAFATSIGTTPHQWRISLRLMRARELLEATDLSLVEIALQCGFYDQSHFSRAFVRWMGTPPGRWRHMAKGVALDGVAQREGL
jgi:transcriptional regulator GlxA family with amidase domain